MSIGRLAAVELPTTTGLLYTVPLDCVGGKINFYYMNPGASALAVETAISPNASSTAASTDYVEKGAIVPASGGVISLTDIVVSPGEKIFGKAAAAGVVLRIAGCIYSKPV